MDLVWWHTGLVVQVLCPVVIGRDAELAAIDAALATAMGGHGGCLVITSTCRAGWLARLGTGELTPPRSVRAGEGPGSPAR